MNSGALPLMLLCATIGLTLSRSGPWDAWSAVAAVATSGLPISLVPVSSGASATIFAGLWASMIATAALIFLPGVWRARFILPVAVFAGGWAGAAVALEDNRPAFLAALPLLLMFIPGRWVAARGYTIGLKVATSWLIAIASLSLVVSQLPMPGYQADHIQ